MFGLFLLVSVLLTGVPFLVRTVYYMEPDDYLLNYIANQSYGAEGSDHLIYIRIVLGKVLQFLYSHFPNVNFYLLLLLILLAAGFALIHYKIYKHSRWPLAVLISLVLQAFVVPFYLTYTVAAFVTALAGAMLLYDGFISAEKKDQIINFVFGLFAIWVSWQLRHDAVLPVVAMLFVALFVFVIHLIQEKEVRRFVQKRGVSIVCGFMIIGLTFSADILLERQAYSAEPWKSFQEFNEARTEIVDFPALNYDTYIEEFQQTDITREMYQSLVSWRFTDKVVFSPEVMRQFAEGPKKVFQENEWRIQASIQYTNSQKALMLLAVLTGILVLVNRKRNRLYILGILILYCAFMGYLLFIRMRCVLRVSLPLTMCAILMMLFVSGERNQSINRALNIVLNSVLSVTMLVVLLFMTKEYRSNTDHMRRPADSEVYQEIRSEIESHPDQLYLVDGALISYLYYYNHPVTTIQREDVFLQLARVGSWDSFSARYYYQAQQFHLKDPDRLLLSPYTDENVSIVTQDIAFYVSYPEWVLGKQYSMEIEEYPGNAAPVYILHFSE